MSLDEPQHFGGDYPIVPNVSAFREPAFQCGWVGALRGHNRNYDLAGALVIRPIACDGRDRIAPKAAARLLV